MNHLRHICSLFLFFFLFSITVSLVRPRPPPNTGRNTAAQEIMLDGSFFFLKIKIYCDLSGWVYIRILLQVSEVRRHLNLALGEFSKASYLP